MDVIRRNLGTLLFFITLMFVRATFANQYVVPSGSMIPAISIGDRIFTNRVAYDLKLPLSNIILKTLDEPKHGDVVVFESPEESGRTLVKRLIAGPGDRVRVINGFIELNGERIDNFNGSQLLYEEELGEHRYSIQREETIRSENLSFTVPPEHYFMMGDNRDNSADGRFFGFVHRSLLIGRADRVLFSMNFPYIDVDRTLMKLD